MSEPDHLRAVEVVPFMGTYEAYGRTAYVIGLRLLLENGDTFTIYSVPYDVAEAIKIHNNGEPPPSRQSLFSLVLFHEEFKSTITRSLRKVVIDEFDSNSNLYTATVHFEDEGVRLNIKMIPSHAIYLALIAQKPIYISRDLVEMARKEEEELEEEFGDEFEEGEY